jgi:hypothetical protein
MKYSIISENEQTVISVNQTISGKKVKELENMRRIWFFATMIHKINNIVR